jgi:hypothetical protein
MGDSTTGAGAWCACATRPSSSGRPRPPPPPGLRPPPRSVASPPRFAHQPGPRLLATATRQSALGPWKSGGRRQRSGKEMRAAHRRQPTHLLTTGYSARQRGGRKGRWRVLSRKLFDSAGESIDWNSASSARAVASHQSSRKLCVNESLSCSYMVLYQTECVWSKLRLYSSSRQRRSPCPPLL